MFVGKAGAYLIVEQLKCAFTWVGSWPFLQTLDKDGKERPARDKHSSLLRIFVKYGRKSFITLGPRVTKHLEKLKDKKYFAFFPLY